MNKVKQRKTYELLKKIPDGKITTYLELSKAVRTSPRVIGYYLKINPNPVQAPCYKVIRSDGRIGGYALGAGNKKILLEQLGLTIKKDRINNFKEVLYKFK